MKIQHSIDGRSNRTARTLALSMTLWAACVLGLILVSAPDVVAAAMPGNPGDPIRGRDLFQKRCGGCHALDDDKEGPRLRGVYGRNAGAVPSFKYSEGMKAARFAWDAASLDRWLTNTESVVPDNDMEFHVPKADERADIIEYLRVSSGK